MRNIIEPCCAERQLGQLLREAHGHAVMFQTQGDVTMTTLLKATMLMSGDRPRTLTISAPTLPQEAMRLVERYAQLGYIFRLRLMLNPDVSPQPSALISHFSSLIPHFDVTIATVNTPPSLLMWQGSTATVVIQGHVPDVVTPTLHLYAAILGGSQSIGVLNAIAPFEALFRARRVEMAAATADGEGEAEPVESAAVPQQPKQPKKTTRKKTTTDEHPEEMA